jgi:superfamily I DNA/RNA helicase
MHFHDLCVRVADEAGLDVPPPPAEADDGDSYFEVVLPGLLERAANRLGPRYAVMVVDEAQDFRNDWWPKLLRLHLHPDDGTLFLFSDDNQNLYGGAAPSELVDTTLPLPSNLRNTQSIHEFVSVFYKGSQRPIGRGPNGRPIEILSYRDDDELRRLLILVLENLAAEDVPLEDIVVLTPARAAKSALRRSARLNGYRLSEEPEPGALLTSTVHGFKGLERPVVILAEIDGRRREDLATYLYVGASRARNHLIVLATEPVARELRALTGVIGA